MSLDAAGLESDLSSFFGGVPATLALCAAEWADAMESYSSGVLPASTTVSAAAATLETALAAITTMAEVDVAFQAFAVTVGAGMLPAFVAVPPPAPPGFVAGVAPPFPATHAAAATKWKDIIDAWMKTGTATPAAGGAPINWS